MRLFLAAVAVLVLVALAVPAPAPAQHLPAVRATWTPETPEPAAPYPTLTPLPDGYPAPVTVTPYVPPYPAPMDRPATRWQVWLPIAMHLSGV